MDDLCSKYDTLTKQLETFQQQSSMRHETLMRFLDAFRSEMRTEFAALKAIKTQRNQLSQKSDGKTWLF